MLLRFWLLCLLVTSQLVNSIVVLILIQSIMFSHKPNKLRLAKCVRQEHEVVVNPNLAYDLSALDEMRRRGVPISVSNSESLYYDGITDATFEVPLESQRGVDINQLWLATKKVNRNLTKLGVSKVDVASKE